jgi:hypothetical protein
MIDATPYSVINRYRKIKRYGTNIISGYMGGELMGPLIFPKIFGRKMTTENDRQKICQIILDHHKLNSIEEVEKLFAHQRVEKKEILCSFEQTVQDIEAISDAKLPNYCATWLYRHENDKYTSFCNFKLRGDFRYTSPFIDNDLVDFMLHTAPMLRYNKYLYKTMLKTYYKDLFALPLKNNFGLGIGANRYALKLRKYYYGGIRRVNKIATRIIKKHLLANKLDNYINYDNYLRTNNAAQEYFHGLLNDLMDRSILNNRSIETLWTEHLDGRKNNAQLLGLLATFESFMKNFMDN